MNEEAMTPDKEQVVEPLSAEEEMRQALAMALHECLPDEVDYRLHPTGEYADEPFCEYLSHALIARVTEPAWLAQNGLDAARTASVAGLDRERLAEAICGARHPIADDVVFVDDECRGIAGRAIAYLERHGSAPSIEQEPGDQFTIGGDPHGWSAPSGTTSDPAALREQEPGETLRAAAPWKSIALSLLSRMNGIALDRTVSTLSNARLVAATGVERAKSAIAALEADSNPQETERTDCPDCGGRGWTMEHDPSDPSGDTPMQKECPTCGGRWRGREPTVNAEELRRLRADITYAMDLRHTYLDREETRWRILETVVSKPFRAFLDEVIERDRLARELARLEADRNPQEPGETLRAAAWRLSNAAESLALHASHPDDPAHRYWFLPAIGDVEREVRLARAAAGREPTPDEYRLALEADSNPQETER